MTNNYIDRAHHLLQLERHAEAEVEARKALAEDPRDGDALAILALCRMNAKAFAEAEDLATQAVAQRPDSPFFYLVLGQASFFNKNTSKARQAIMEGQRLAPGEAAFFHLRAQLEFYQENWELALRETERGLELDPENVDLVNLRAQALVKLNRQADAAATLDYALHKAPENSDAHANKGWVAIEQDRYDEAVQHFLEALRLEPDNDYARNGLKEAIKGKNLLYRGILKYFLWMNKLQERGRWAVVIGAYLLYRLLLKIGESVPELAPLVYPLAAAYVVFAFSSWIAKPVSNLFLRFHRLGKYAMNADELLGSNLVGGLLLTCLASFTAYFFTKEESLFRLGLVLGILTIPTGGAFIVPKGTGSRRNLMVYAAVLAAIGLLWVITEAGQAIAVFALGVLLYSFVANYFVGKEAKAFR